jgi:hypothetical protein
VTAAGPAAARHQPLPLSPIVQRTEFGLQRILHPDVQGSLHLQPSGRQSGLVAEPASGAGSGPHYRAVFDAHVTVRQWRRGERRGVPRRRARPGRDTTADLRGVARLAGPAATDQVEIRRLQIVQEQHRGTRGGPSARPSTSHPSPACPWTTSPTCLWSPVRTAGSGLPAVDVGALAAHDVAGHDVLRLTGGALPGHPRVRPQRAVPDGSRGALARRPPSSPGGNRRGQHRRHRGHRSTHSGGPPRPQTPARGRHPGGGGPHGPRPVAAARRQVHPPCHPGSPASGPSPCAPTPPALRRAREKGDLVGGYPRPSQGSPAAPATLILYLPLACPS